MKYFRYLGVLSIVLSIAISGCKKGTENKNTTNKLSNTKVNNVVDTLEQDTLTNPTKSNIGDTSSKEDIGKDRPLSLNYTLPTLDGASFTLHDNKGKVIIMDFWATWCGPCRREIPELIKLNDDLKNKGLLVVGIGLDNSVKLKNFAKEYGIDYTVLQGTQQIAQQYGVKGIPTTYILDKKGRIVKRFVGYYSGLEKEMRSIVESTLKE